VVTKDHRTLTEASDRLEAGSDGLTLGSGASGSHRTLLLGPTVAAWAASDRTLALFIQGGPLIRMQEGSKGAVGP
jgi:hypothetical protein